MEIPHVPWLVIIFLWLSYGFRLFPLTQWLPSSTFHQASPKGTVHPEGETTKARGATYASPILIRKAWKNHVCIHIYMYIYKLYPYSFTYILSWYKCIHHINVYIILYNHRIIYKYIYIGSCLKQQISQLHIFHNALILWGFVIWMKTSHCRSTNNQIVEKKMLNPSNPQQIEQNSRKWCSIVLEIAGLVCING